MSKFKDIEIIDLEQELHYQAQHEPLFYFFYLRLSKQPPPWWCAAFMGEYGVPRLVRVGQMHLGVRHVVLLSDFERAETYILRARSAVDWANTQYRGFLEMVEKTGGGIIPQQQEISGENMAVLRGRIFGKGPFAKLREDPNWRPSRKGNGR